MKLNSFLIVIILSAVSIAGTAAFFSVTGIASLFKGHFLSVAIMASVLEFGKLVVASFIYRYWYDINSIFKYYLLISLFILMGITSAGIFGYLSESYQTTKSDYTIIDNKITSYSLKKQNFIDRKNRLLNEKDLQLLTIKSNRTRIDSLTSKNQNVTRTRQDIKDSENKINELEKNIFNSEDSINYYDVKILELQNNNATSELGPLKYISLAFNSDMDSVVKFFILILIFVFDPLAVSLVIAANITYSKIVGYKSEFTEILSAKNEQEKINKSNIINEETEHQKNTIEIENNKNILEQVPHSKEIKSEEVTSKNIPWHSANWINNKK